MTMTDTHQNVSGIILDDYYNGLLSTYGLAVSLTEEHSEQVNNEIRNGLTHIARALDSKNATKSQEDLKKARGHFERGRKDCYKICFVKLAEKIEEQIYLIEMTEGRISSAIKRRLTTLKKQRKHLFEAETKNNHKNIMTLYENLINGLFDLHWFLSEEYTNPQKAIPRLKRLFGKITRRTRHVIYIIALGLIINWLSKKF